MIYFLNCINIMIALCFWVSAVAVAEGNELVASFITVLAIVLIIASVVLSFSIEKQLKANKEKDSENKNKENKI